jgi:hypothetical protein
MLKLTRDEFVKRKVGEKHEMPPYFNVMERYNLEDIDSWKNLGYPLVKN